MKRLVATLSLLLTAALPLAAETPSSVYDVPLKDIDGKAASLKPYAGKVLLIVNEANETVYLSGRNIPTLAINTAHAVQVRAGAGAPLAAVWCVVSAWGSAVPHMRIVLQHPPFSLPGPHTYTPAPPPALLWQVYDVLNADHILVEQGALAYLNEWFGGEEAAAAAEAAQ